jgi:hypothetical protein
VRQFNALMGELPWQVREQAARYLGLFRVGERGLSWKRALRILQELKELTNLGTVHWEGGETRPAPAGLWAEVMCEMCEKGKRELDSHNYLRKVVWTRARPLAVKEEQEKRKIFTAENAESAEEKHRPREGGEPGPNETRPKKRGCFVCASFRPPKGCDARSRPVSENQILGCGKWTEKKAAGSVGELMEGIAKQFTAENAEKIEGKE